MAELNDEQALSYAETLVNSFRALQWLEDVVRYARNCRLDIEQLDPRRQIALAETTKAEIRMAEVKENLEALTTETGAIRYELAAETARLESIAQGLRVEVEDLTSRKSALGEEFNGLSETIRNQQQKVQQLTETEASLIQRVEGLESRLDELRQAAAKIAG